jgi:hypothetical protein
MPILGIAASAPPAAEGDAARAPSGSGGGSVKVIQSPATIQFLDSHHLSCCLLQFCASASLFSLCLFCENLFPFQLPSDRTSIPREKRFFFIDEKTKD